MRQNASKAVTDAKGESLSRFSLLFEHDLRANAWNVRFGSNADLTAPKRDFRSHLNNGHH